jgi:DNA invertase Pin-like site-specific DNA recombinase
MIFEQRIYKAGLYLRLSKDDDVQGESNSIGTQRALLEQYCAEHGIQVIEEYCDDGWSGMNFDRPNFQRMITDVLSGRINLVITKDLSRFGRDYIEAGQYIEKLFQRHNIRYIAVTDGVDTLKGNDEILMPIKNVINNLYSKDVSRKVRSAFNTKAKDGQYIASKPPFGYTKSPTDRHKLIIDDEAAEVVRKIFLMASEGYGYNKMTRALEGTPNPITYFMLKNPDYFKNPRWKPNYTWNNKSISVILNNTVYLGNLSYGKTRTVIVGGKDASRRPKEEWIVVENTHEPVISQELWDNAHAVLSVRRKATDENKEPHLFAGLIKCADCGSALMFHNRRYKDGHRGEFRCFKYSRQGKDFCKSHYITYNKVYGAVYESIKALAATASQSEQKFLNRLKEESDLLSGSKAKKAQSEYEKAEKRIAALDQIMKRLYEDSVLGIIPRERCQTMMREYEQEQSELKEKAELYRQQLQGSNENAEKALMFAKLVKKATKITTLDVAMLYQLISRIEVGHAEENPESGRKEQKLKLHYKYNETALELAL